MSTQNAFKDIIREGKYAQLTWRSQGTLTFTNVPWLRMENGVVQNEKRKEKLLNLEKEGMELYLF